jgi:hypothetical protein
MMEMAMAMSNGEPAKASRLCASVCGHESAAALTLQVSQ